MANEKPWCSCGDELETGGVCERCWQELNAVYDKLYATKKQLDEEIDRHHKLIQNTPPVKFINADAWEMGNSCGKIAELEKQLSEANDQCRALHDACTITEGRLAASEAAWAAMQENVDFHSKTRQETHAEALKEIKRLSKENASLHECILDLDAQIERLVTESDLQDLESRWDKWTAALQAERDVLRKRVAELEAERPELISLRAHRDALVRVLPPPNNFETTVTDQVRIIVAKNERFRAAIEWFFSSPYKDTALVDELRKRAGL